MKEFITKNKVIVGIIVLVLVLVFFISEGVARKKEEQKQAEKDKLSSELLEEANKDYYDENDNLLMQMQPELEKTYGKVPDGFIWEADGTVLSLGDKSMSAEEVVYAYFRGLSSLDMSTASRYSRSSTVVDTYSGYFDEANKNTDYTDQFLRNIYRYCLLSMQVEGIDNVSVFADNKQVFSVKVKILDLTDKDFWQNDKEELFKNLKIYESDQSDSAKGEIYLYDYLLDYYKSENAKLRTVTFDITVQKYADLDSGWLVSVDNDVNDACSYKDGKLVVSYIREVYRNEETSN